MRVESTPAVEQICFNFGEFGTSLWAFARLKKDFGSFLSSFNRYYGTPSRPRTLT